MKVKSILKETISKKYGYIRRVEVWDDSDYGGDGNLEVISYYSKFDLSYIGSKRDTMFLCKRKGLTKIQRNIGFNEQEQKWYGWSHRAIFGFGIGDKLFIKRFGNDKTHFAKHGRKTITKLTEAKLAAKRFASSVS